MIRSLIKGGAYTTPDCTVTRLSVCVVCNTEYIKQYTVESRDYIFSILETVFNICDVCVSGRASYMPEVPNNVYNEMLEALVKLTVLHSDKYIRLVDSSAVNPRRERVFFDCRDYDNFMKRCYITPNFIRGTPPPYEP